MTQLQPRYLNIKYSVSTDLKSLTACLYGIALNLPKLAEQLCTSNGLVLPQAVWFKTPILSNLCACFIAFCNSFRESGVQNRNRIKPISITFVALDSILKNGISSPTTHRYSTNYVYKDSKCTEVIQTWKSTSTSSQKTVTSKNGLSNIFC